MQETSSAAEASDFQDRSKRLFVVGTLLIVLGCGAVLLAAVVGAGPLFLPATPESPAYGLRHVAPTVFFYCGVAAVLLAVGFGSVRPRRWARPLGLILGWGWLAAALFGGVMALAILSRTLDEPGLVLSCFVVPFGLFGILLPTMLILLYRAHDVEATLAARDPESRWTDRIPTPLLGLSLWLGITACGMLTGVFQPILPMGFTVLTGPAAATLFLVMAGLWGYAAIGLARRRRSAWWVALVSTLAWGLWAVAVLPRTDFATDVAPLMDLPGEAPAGMDLGGMYQSPWFLGPVLVAWMALTAYIVFARRYLDFGKPGDAARANGWMES